MNAPKCYNPKPVFAYGAKTPGVPQPSVLQAFPEVAVFGPDKVCRWSEADKFYVPDDAIAEASAAKVTRPMLIIEIEPSAHQDAERGKNVWDVGAARTEADAIWTAQQFNRVLTAVNRVYKGKVALYGVLPTSVNSWGELDADKMKRMRRRNDVVCDVLYDLVDFLTAVLYPKTENVDAHIAAMDMQCREARRMGGKKLYGITSHRMYDAGGQFVSPELHQATLDLTYRRCDGIIPFSSPRIRPEDEEGPWQPQVRQYADGGIR